MDGKTTKYFYYDSNKQSILRIPVSIAKSLNWHSKDEINVEIKAIDGNLGIFLYKKKRKSIEEYHFEFINSFQLLEKYLNIIANEYGLREYSSELYAVHGLINILEEKTILDEDILNNLKKVSNFRNRLVHDSDFNPSISEFEEIARECELLKKQLFDLIINFDKGEK